MATPIPFEGAFATIDDFKAQIGNFASAADEDDEILAMLRNTAGAIEQAAGRPLRRRHWQTEYFAGGKRVIRTKMSHIAKIHSIRESNTRDFTTSGSYDELTEGTDYVLEVGRNGEDPGESGAIRRLNGNWMGSRQSPAQVQVIYTGGFKTAQELAVEPTGGSIDIQPPTQDFGLFSTYIDVAAQTYGISDTDDATVELKYDSYGSILKRFGMIVYFKTDQLIVPNWQIVNGTFTIYAKFISGITTDIVLRAVPLAVDPLTDDWETLYDAIDAADDIDTFELDDTMTEWTKNIFTIQAHLTTDVTAMARHGYIAFALWPTTVTTADSSHKIVSMEEETDVSYRPKLSLKLQVITRDNFIVPDDLRHANLLQAVNNYQTRRNPGMKSQSARGVSIASGHSFMKDPASLLPEVREIADSYRRIY